jgi:hypothetical protein
MRGDGVEFGEFGGAVEQAALIFGKATGNERGKPVTVGIGGGAYRRVGHEKLRPRRRSARGNEAGLVDVAARRTMFAPEPGVKLLHHVARALNLADFARRWGVFRWGCVSSVPRMGASLLNPSTFLSFAWFHASANGSRVDARRH